MGHNTSIINRKARYNYTVIESFEAGIALKGTEVKSVRNGKASLQEAYARVDNEEVYVHKMHIDPYKFGNIANVDPLRKRKLLLHKAQIAKLAKESLQKGLALIPLKLYFKKGYAKIELGLCQSKQKFDKRESIKKRESDRQMRRALKHGRKA